MRIECATESEKHLRLRAQKMATGSPPDMSNHSTAGVFRKHNAWYDFNLKVHITQP